jgi:hypothetical protein
MGTVRFDIINKIMILVQCIISVVVVFVVIQIVVKEYYSISSLIVITWISYGFSSSMMGLLAKHFFSWYKTNRNSLILFYGLSSILLSLNAIFTIAFVNDALFSRSEDVRPHVGIGVSFLYIFHFFNTCVYSNMDLYRFTFEILFSKDRKAQVLD